MIFGQGVKGALRGSLAESGFLADCCPGRAAFAQRGNPASIRRHTRPAEPFALRAGCFETRPDTLRDADTLLLGHRGNDGDHGVFEDAAAIEILRVDCDSQGFPRSSWPKSLGITTPRQSGDSGFDAW